jgi:hypothetical protein
MKNKEKSDVEKPFPESPYINNTNSNGLNGMSSNNIDSIPEINNH